MADVAVLTLSELRRRVENWCFMLKEAKDLVAVPGAPGEPYKNIYAAIELAEKVDFEVTVMSNMPEVKANATICFWVRFTKIHVLSSLAKWNELCDQISTAQQDHLQCIELLEKLLGIGGHGSPPKRSFNPKMRNLSLQSQPNSNEVVKEDEEVKKGKKRVNFMYIYELTRYAILCSERDDQDKALDLLKKAEKFYHDGAMDQQDCIREPKVARSQRTILQHLDALNPDSAKEMFTYVLFYLGQAYKIAGEKELAILYLHMVLRRQLEKGDHNTVQWASDCGRMASVLMAHTQVLITSREMLVAATTVLLQTPDEEKDKDVYKEGYGDLGRLWCKLGVNLLESSGDRLKDLEESEGQRVMPLKSRLKLSKYQRASLEITAEVEVDGQSEEDTLLLINSLKFPSLDTTATQENEMKIKTFIRDFDEAREVFLCAQRWLNEARKYYTIDEYCSDYIDLTCDYAALFKHLAFFEGSIDRRVKMHKRRVTILEELLSQLNPKVYEDIVHFVLRDLAETYENIYKLKVDECKDRGKSLRPKDQKLVQWLVDAVGAHKRNLSLFNYNMEDPSKSFPKDYERILMATVLSVGRILGSVCHDHPLHPDAVKLGEESKQFYSYFLAYLDRRIDLKREFRVLYEGSEDMPELLDSQIRKIQHHQQQRQRIAAESENPVS